LFVQFFRVLQRERYIVGPGAQRERLAGENEETFLACFHFVIAGRKIAQQKASCAVGFGAIALTCAALQRNFRGGDGHVIFINDDAPAVSGIRSGDYRRADSAKENEERRDASGRAHALSWHSPAIAVQRFSRWEVSRQQSWRKTRKISCAAVFAQFVILVFAVVSTARKSRPADRWRERILRKLRRPDPDPAKPRRDLAGRAPPVWPSKFRAFRQA